MERKKCLLMFSGGMDSILSMVRLVSTGYKALLVHFFNGLSDSSGYEIDRAFELEKQFGAK